jgi:hypothetical protein
MSTPPPAPQGGGNAKFAIIGILLLLGGGAAIFFLTRKPTATETPHPTPPVATVHDAGPPEPTGPQIGAQFELPQEEPDAGQPEASDAGQNRPHIRYVTRYVAACPGTVDGPRVTAVVRQNYGGLRECYNRQLRSNPALRGNVTAEWVIQPNGSVGQISTSGAVARDRTFKSCFETSLSRLRFPAPHGGCAMFQQSFSFTPDGA